MNKNDLAYIAGFFDGDGSVRLQFQPRGDVKLGFRIRAVISFAQKIGHEKELDWIRNKFGIGYLYRRNDGMSELRIEGFEKVQDILVQLAPFVRFKKRQVSLVLKALKLVDDQKKNILKIAEISDSISEINYATTKKKYNAEYIRNSLKTYPRND